MSSKDLIEQFREGILEIQELQDLVHKTNQEQREYAINLHLLYGLNKTLLTSYTRAYNGLDSITIDEGILYQVDANTRFPEELVGDAVENYPITIHTHPNGEESNASYILPSGFFVGNDIRGQFGDIHSLFQFRMAGEYNMNPMIIASNFGITFPFAAVNLDFKDRYINILRRKYSQREQDKMYATSIWSVWDSGDYNPFDQFDIDDKTLERSLEKGFSVTRYTSKSDDERKELYFCSVSWSMIEQYIRDKGYSSRDFWEQVGLYSYGMTDFIRNITNNDLPNELLNTDNNLEGLRIKSLYGFLYDYRRNYINK